MERYSLLKGSRPLRRNRLPLNRLFFFGILILFIVVLIIGFRFSGAHRDLQNQAEWALALSDVPPGDMGTNYLLYGIYEEEGELYLEDIFLLNYPADKKTPHVIFVPGELLLSRRASSENVTQTPPPERDDGETENDEDNGVINNRLATLFFPSHFYEEGGTKGLIEQLSYFLGVPVHYFLEVDYQGVPEMVDYRGGIDYRGYMLRGEEYYEYFLEGQRDEEPVERALRRMQALGSLVEYVGEKRGVFSKSRSVRKASPYLDTNMSWNELEEFYQSLDPLLAGKKDDVIRLPGTWRQQIDGKNVFEPQREQISYLMANLGKEFILPREMITVEVLNGCGVAGIAAKVGELLTAEGFKVVNVDNADSFEYPRSQVIARQQEMDPAREVAVLIPGAELFKEEIDGYEAMVTVIIGKNFTLD